MLYKLSTTDVQNTTVIDCSSDAVAFRISTSTPGNRSRSLSASSFYSFASSSSLSRENLSVASQKITSLKDADDDLLAEIVWEGSTASHIRIGNETLAGTSEIFDAAFVKVLPDETLIPTRMEFVWRTTPESLTLLDDDGEVIGILHQDSLLLEGELVPASKPGAGHNYLELVGIPAVDLDEILVTFVLISALRERMYWITKYVYGKQSHLAATPPRSPLRKLRRQASRSFANWKQSLFRNRKH